MQKPRGSICFSAYFEFIQEVEAAAAKAKMSVATYVREALTARMYNK